jgi:hypothetical protein
VSAAALIRDRCASLAIALRAGVAAGCVTESECTDLEELLHRLSDRVTARRHAAGTTDGQPLRVSVLEVLRRTGQPMTAPMLADELPGVLPSSLGTCLARLWMRGVLHRRVDGAVPVYSLAPA